MSGSLKFPEKMQCLFQPKRYKVFFGGRGGAKSWNIARWLLVRGVMQPTRVLCVRELQNSMDDSVYALLKDQIEEMGLGDKYQVLRTEIIGPNGTSFAFEGIKNNPRKIKSYEGTDVCWAEEADKISQASWNILIPTIRKPGSEIVISFNPDLETDYTYKRFVQSPPEDAFVVEMSWRENPWFPEVLAKEKDELERHDYDEYLHVWEGKCRTVLGGAVYATELRAAIAGGRIGRVPWQPALPVDVFFDLGWADMTCLLFRQKVGFEWHYIDYEENRKKPFSHYLGILQEKRYLIANLWLPHDAKAKEKGTGTSVEEIARAAYPGRVRIVKKLGLEDGINAGREIMPLCWFDDKNLGPFIHHMQHYKYEVLDADGALSRVPVHDEHSHSADTFRYSAVSTKTGALTTRAEAQIGLLERTKRCLLPQHHATSGSYDWLSS